MVAPFRTKITRDTELSRFVAKLFHVSTILDTMAVPDRRMEASESNRTLIIVVAVVAAIAIAGLFYVLMYLMGSGRTTEAGLAGRYPRRFAAV